MANENAICLPGSNAELSSVGSELSTTDDTKPSWSQNELLRVVVKNSFLHFEDKTPQIVEETNRPRARSASFCSVAVSSEPKTVSSFSHRRCRSAATPSTAATFLPKTTTPTVQDMSPAQTSSATMSANLSDNTPMLKNLMSPQLVMLNTIGSPAPSTRAESIDFPQVSDLSLGEPMLPSTKCYVNTLEDTALLEVSTLEEATPGCNRAKRRRRRRRGAKKDGAAGFTDRSKNFSGVERYAHSRVPKTKNLMQEFSNNAVYAPKTTLMIRNIPNRYRQRELVTELNANDLQGKYDFVYLPMDKSTTSNVGYAFVNFTEEETAAHAMVLFQGYRFKKYQSISRKIASVSVAYIQGLENNVKHYNQCAVNEAKLKEHRPLVRPQSRAVDI